MTQRISPLEHVSIVMRVCEALNTALDAPVKLLDYRLRLGGEHVFELDMDATHDLKDRYGTRPLHSQGIYLMIFAA